MAGRRSERVKKHLDYTSFLENDNSDESDDDFVGKSAPPLKKAKSSQEENIKKCEDLLTPEKEKNNNSSKKNTKTKRKKLDEKIFEREIKMAMELSMQNVNPEKTLERKKNSCETKSERKKNSCETKSETNKTLPHKELLYLSRHDIHSPPKSPPVLTSNASHENEEQTKDTNKQPIMPILTPVMNGPSDDIEFLGLADEDEKRQRNRRPSRRSVKKTIEYKPEDSDDDDDDDDDDEFEEQESDSEEQSDFEEKAKSKKKKPLPTKSKKENRKNSACSSSTRVHQKIQPKKTISSPLSSSSSSSTTAATQNSTDPIKLVHKSALSKERINFTSPVNVSSKTVSDSLTSPKISPKIPAWNPPRKSVGNVTNLTSPPSIRRLGLSRNQKVKPLHPTLKVNH